MSFKTCTTLFRWKTVYTNKHCKKIKPVNKTFNQLTDLKHNTGKGLISEEMS